MRDDGLPDCVYAGRKREDSRLGLSHFLVGVRHVLKHACCCYTVSFLYHCFTRINDVYIHRLHHPYLQNSASKSASLRLYKPLRSSPTVSTASAPKLLYPPFSPSLPLRARLQLLPQTLSLSPSPPFPPFSSVRSPSPKTALNPPS